VKKLINSWHEYKTAQQSTPYDPNKVQALGMAFCDQWKIHKDEILYHFPLADDEEWGYNLHHKIMPELAAEFGFLQSAAKMVFQRLSEAPQGA
jgi:hypothetical protein